MDYQLLVMKIDVMELPEKWMHAIILNMVT